MSEDEHFDRNVHVLTTSGMSQLCQVCFTMMSSPNNADGPPPPARCHSEMGCKDRFRSPVPLSLFGEVATLHCSPRLNRFGGGGGGEILDYQSFFSTCV